jgi:hypothetical protein
MRSLALLRKDMLCSAQCWKEWGLAEDCAHLVVVLEKHYNNAKAFNASAPNQYNPTEFTWLLVQSGVLCVCVPGVGFRPFTLTGCSISVLSERVRVALPDSRAHCPDEWMVK